MFESFSKKNNIEKKEIFPNKENFLKNFDVFKKLVKVIGLSMIFWFGNGQTKALADTKEETMKASEQQKEWLLDYIDSDKYKERLMKEFGRYRKLGFPQSYESFMASSNFQKTMELSDKKPYEILDMVLPIDENKDLSEKDEKTVDGEISGRRKSVGGIDFKVSDSIPGGLYGVTNIQNEVDILDFGKQTKDTTSFTTPVHEFTHASTEGNQNIFNESFWVVKNKQAEKGFFDPTEVMARMNQLRFLMEKYGISDQKNSDFTGIDYEKVLSTPEIMNDFGVHQLMEWLDKDSLIWLMNNVADALSSPVNSLETKA